MANISIAGLLERRKRVFYGWWIVMAGSIQGAREYSIDVTNNRISNARFSVPEAMLLLRGLGVRLEGMDPT